MAQLRAKLLTMQAEVTVAMKEASLAGANVLREEAALIAPRSDSPTGIGHMADHINVKTMPGTSPLHVRVRIGPDPDHFYGRFLETGTSKMAAQPFLRPALDTKSKEALDKFGEVVKRRLK
jgi:HK97 gp10 family phage protein